MNHKENMSYKELLALVRQYKREGVQIVSLPPDELADVEAAILKNVPPLQHKETAVSESCKFIFHGILFTESEIKISNELERIES